MRDEPGYNRRQYERMLACIDLYRNNQISLPKLIADIEALISALQNVSLQWRNVLLGAWAPLEDAYANALYEKRNALSDEERRVVAAALDDLERTIKSRGLQSDSPAS